MPVRLNHWRLVDPLESLAGAHPIDDVVVKLVGNVTVRDDRDGTTSVVRRTRTGANHRALLRTGAVSRAGTGIRRRLFASVHFDRAAARVQRCRRSRAHAAGRARSRRRRQLGRPRHRAFAAQRRRLVRVRSVRSAKGGSSCSRWRRARCCARMAAATALADGARSVSLRAPGRLARHRGGEGRIVSREHAAMETRRRRFGRAYLRRHRRRKARKGRIGTDLLRALRIRRCRGRRRSALPASRASTSPTIRSTRRTATD